MARLVVFIYSEEARGDGTIKPVRLVQRLYALGGYLVAEHDPCGVSYVEAGKPAWYEPSSFARDLDRGAFCHPDKGDG